jgi:TPR repeat protein
MLTFHAGNTGSVADLLSTWRRGRLVSRWQVRRLQPGADAADPADAFNLAIALERLGKDSGAERWYRWVAETGDADATCNPGLLLARTGRENEALKYLGIAAGQGDSDAAYNAGAVCEDTDDLQGARHWYARAAELGDRNAAAWLRKHPSPGQPRRDRIHRCVSLIWSVILE